MLLSAEELGCTEEMLTIVALLTAENVFQVGSMAWSLVMGIYICTFGTKLSQMFSTYSPPFCSMVETYIVTFVLS